MSEPPIIRLVPAPERAAEEERAYVDAAHEEAVHMLERALDLVRERRVSSVGIAIAFTDRTYGTLIPVAGNDIGLLLGAISDLQFRVLLSTNDVARGG